MSAAAVNHDQITWRDPKRHLWMLGLIVPVLPFLAYGLVELTGLGAFWFFGPVLIFGIFPLLDLALGLDRRNPPEALLKWLEDDRYYRWCTCAFIPLQYAGLVFACSQWASGDLSAVESIGLALTTAMVAGVAINTAHELGHKRTQHERRLSKIALAQSGYGHFFIEHNRGHHVRVATPEDPASSRLGEGFWEFLPRTVSGSLRSAWGIERRRLQRGGHALWSWRNDILTAWAMTLVLFGALTVAFGPVVLPCLLLQAAVGSSLLEVVNYLEHYGLLRQRRPDGRYEITRPEHSWNANNVASNVLLYHLQRHSDHHANPTRRYQALRHVDDAPQLPTGYAGMIVLALCPPLWRRVMDHRLLAHYGGDPARANISPRARERILVRYGGSAAAGAPASTAPAPASAAPATASAAPAPLSAAHAPASAAPATASAARADRPRFRCPGCGYVYDEQAGAPREGIAAGTAWSEVPPDWACPDCGVRDKLDFGPVRA